MTLNSFAQAEDRKIGVAVSAVINGSPGTGPEVSEALGAALETELKVTVIAGLESQNLLPEAARSETCLGDATCLVAAGKALGVDELLMLIIIDSAESVKVEATWVDIATGKTALREPISASKGSDSMAEEFAASATSLLPGIEVRAPIVDDKPDPNDPANNPDVVVPNPNLTKQPVVADEGGKHFTMLSGGLAAGGGLAVAISLGIGYSIYSNDDCEKSTNCDGKGKSTAADVFLVGGAAALGGALYLYLTSDDSNEAPPVAITASGEAVGFTLGGQF